MNIVSPTGQEYLVDADLSLVKPGAAAFDYYPCQLPEGEMGLLKIAANTSHNGLLDREAFLLSEMKQQARRLEARHTSAKGGHASPLNYHFLFPNLVETFTVKNQEGRRVMVISLSEICKELTELVMINRITSPEWEHSRVDPRTSAWILGKLLKLLQFCHDYKISGLNLRSDNIFINKGQHYVALVDWSGAAFSDEAIEPEMVGEEIAAATKDVIVLLGGNPATLEIPNDKQLADGLYAAMLARLASGQEADAFTAHADFYKLIRSIWPREFWPYTTYPLGKES